VLAVSPTHAEGAKVTEAIREQLRATDKDERQAGLPEPRTAKKKRDTEPKKMLDSVEHQFTKLEKLKLTEAERGDARRYQPGLVVQFNQKAKGFENGERAGVVAVSAAGVEVVNGRGQNVMLPLDQAGRFELFRESRIGVAVGDKVRITKNGFTVPDTGKGKGHRLNNGTLYEVKGFTKAGDIKLNNDWVVRRDYGHLAYGYCSTSHASQGKTVDRVLIAQSAASFRAASKEQFYVSVSRGREAVRVFTDDLKVLKEAVGQTTIRMSARELMKKTSVVHRSVKRSVEVQRVARSLAKIHAARAVEAAKESARVAAKDAARQVDTARSWAERVRPQRRMEIEME
jgi:hypothetical protein